MEGEIRGKVGRKKGREGIEILTIVIVDFDLPGEQFSFSTLRS